MFKYLPIIFLLIAFTGIGFLISTVLGLFGSDNDNNNSNTNINDMISELRQNQSTVVIVINNNTVQ